MSYSFLFFLLVFDTTKRLFKPPKSPKYCIKMFFRINKIDDIYCNSDKYPLHIYNSAQHFIFLYLQDDTVLVFYSDVKRKCSNQSNELYNRTTTALSMHMTNF